MTMYKRILVPVENSPYDDAILQHERDGIDAASVLAGGEPSREIAEAAAREQCDLIARSTHGHRFVKDLLYGSVANEVRHITRVPVLQVRGGPDQEHDAKERAPAPEPAKPA